MEHQWPLAILSLGGLGALAFCALWQTVMRPGHGHILHWKGDCWKCQHERETGITGDEE